MATAIRSKPKSVVPSIPPVAPDELFRLTVDQYRRMIEAGVLGEDDRCELLHGLIVEKMPPDPPHSKATHRANRSLAELLPKISWVIGVQDPITLSDSQPEPDLYVAAGPDDRYDERHPGPRDLVLVVEVADTSLRIDTTIKLAMYAAARIPVYWIVNLPDRRVEVYTQPRGGKAPAYRTRTDYAPGQSVPVTVAGTVLGSIPVSELLP